MKKRESCCLAARNMIECSWMAIILTILPESARLYTGTLSGIRRRLGSDYELKTVDYFIDAPTLCHLIDFWNPAGCIVAAAQGIDASITRAFGKTPVVYLDRSPFMRGNFLDVMQDYEENGRIAARELIQADLDDYAFVGTMNPTNWSKARGVSFARSVRLQRKTCHVFSMETFAEDWHMRLERWLMSLPKPVGIFTANDITALAVHEILTRNHIAIPDEAELLGIDNIVSTCEMAVPNISSIASDFEQGGWECADLLIERLSNPKMRKAMRTYPSLGVIRRASTHCRGGFSQQVLVAVNTIRARACEGITVDDIAASMNCSRRIAEMRFRIGTGKTIKEALTTTRMDRASVLLRDRSLSIGEISTMCGYGTENAMRIAFRKHFGMTLSEWRRKIRYN